MIGDLTPIIHSYRSVAGSTNIHVNVIQVAREAALMPQGMRLLPEDEREALLCSLIRSKHEAEAALQALPFVIETHSQVRTCLPSCPRLENLEYKCNSRRLVSFCLPACLPEELPAPARFIQSCRHKVTSPCVLYIYGSAVPTSTACPALLMSGVCAPVRRGSTRKMWRLVSQRLRRRCGSSRIERF